MIINEMIKAFIKLRVLRELRLCRGLERGRARAGRAAERLHASLTSARSLATNVGETPGDPILDTVYEQPNIRHIIDTMFGTSEVGTPTGWSGMPAYRGSLRP